MGRFARFQILLHMRFRLAKIDRVLASCGADLEGRYGVNPDLQSPAVIYPLDSPAGAYAEMNLLSASEAPLRRLLRCMAGCDTSLGGILVIGRKP